MPSSVDFDRVHSGGRCRDMCRLMWVGGKLRACIESVLDGKSLGVNCFDFSPSQKDKAVGFVTGLPSNSRQVGKAAREEIMRLRERLRGANRRSKNLKTDLDRALDLMTPEQRKVFDFGYTDFSNDLAQAKNQLSHYKIRLSDTEKKLRHAENNRNVKKKEAWAYLSCIKEMESVLERFNAKSFEELLEEGGA